MLNIGLLGAGYIAEHHLKALKAISYANVKGICDINPLHAKRLAEQIPHAKVFNSLDKMLESEKWDVIHILTPPDYHYSIAEKILTRGIHVFIEKPMALCVKDCQNLCEIASNNGAQIGINHNFLFYSSYLELKKNISQKKIGKFDHITITWHQNLDQLQNGPYGIWMLREPQNLFLEIGTHLCAILLDLIDEPEIIFVHPSKLLELPTGVNLYRQWMILGGVKNITFEIRLSLNPGFSEKSVTIRGQSGFASVDFLRNCFTLKRHTKFSLPFDNYFMNKQENLQLKHQNFVNLKTYVKSKFKLSLFGDPYANSIYNSILAFYTFLKDNVTYNNTGEFGSKVIKLCEKIVTHIPPKSPIIKKSFSSSIHPEILVLGGTGFIGSHLVKFLTNSGKKVRILARDPSKFMNFNHEGRLEVISGDILDPLSLKKAFRNIQYVFHLATARAKTWDEYYRLDIEPTQRIAENCLENGVKRLVYTGTIDSYYAGSSGEVITENTSLDPNINQRNYYAHAKALSEQILLSLHEKNNLPVVIIRPGIVIGEGSSPYHWGIGMWHYETVCQLWGKGNNPLPFVLVDDVVKGLALSMEKKDIEGQSFNLIDSPCITAKEYLQALETSLETNLIIQEIPIWRFFIWDCYKYFIKCLVGHKDKRQPSWRDWANRSQLATYDCTKARKVLGWQPANSKIKILENGVSHAAKTWWA
jgi:nucleoside-diphosphate-sugar epimerase/predicted dehydrogenase